MQSSALIQLEKPIGYHGERSFEGGYVATSSLEANKDDLNQKPHHQCHQSDALKIRFLDATVWNVLRCGYGGSDVSVPGTRTQPEVIPGSGRRRRR
ncbi:hypothetical protein pipiens_001567 [Culex pipiens pipiens]|uniref:Uncharacterized protein n=1 Tax=Culex pipiens pipiens TaxID=38569 RepID=A0ABD1CKT3_CULPP